MTYVIAEPCIDVKDKSCIAECPVDCIYEGDRMLYIQADECVDSVAHVLRRSGFYVCDNVANNQCATARRNLDTCRRATLRRNVDTCGDRRVVNHPGAAKTTGADSESLIRRTDGADCNAFRTSFDCFAGWAILRCVARRITIETLPV